MKQERVVLSFIMVLVGLLVAGVAFYFYQSTKAINVKPNQITATITPTPTQDSSFFIEINNPKDEEISDSKTIKISGKTLPDATIAILTSSDQEVIQPSRDGDFSTTLQLDEGVNYIKIQAFAPNGETKIIEKIVSYTTEDF